MQWHFLRPLCPRVHCTTSLYYRDFGETLTAAKLYNFKLCKKKRKKTRAKVQTKSSLNLCVSTTFLGHCKWVEIIEMTELIDVVIIVAQNIDCWQSPHMTRPFLILVQIRSIGILCELLHSSTVPAWHVVCTHAFVPGQWTLQQPASKEQTLFFILSHFLKETPDHVSLLIFKPSEKKD